MTLRLRRGQLQNPAASATPVGTASVRQTHPTLQIRSDQMKSFEQSAAHPVKQPCPACAELDEIESEMNQLNKEYAELQKTCHQEKQWYDSRPISDRAPGDADNLQHIEKALDENMRKAAALARRRAALRQQLDGRKPILRRSAQVSQPSSTGSTQSRTASTSVRGADKSTVEKVQVEPKPSRPESPFGADAQTSEGGARINVPADIPGLPPPRPFSTG